MDTSTKNQLGRRKFLKIIAAAGGAIGVSALLPEEWVEPVIKTGVLPVHAQTSGLGSISGIATDGTNPIPGAQVALYYYSDPGGSPTTTTEIIAGAGGAFRFNDLVAGHYRLHGYDDGSGEEGHYPGFGDFIILNDGQNKKGIELEIN